MKNLLKNITTLFKYHSSLIILSVYCLGVIGFSFLEEAIWGAMILATLLIMKKGTKSLIVRRLLLYLLFLLVGMTHTAYKKHSYTQHQKIFNNNEITGTLMDLPELKNKRYRFKIKTPDHGVVMVKTKVSVKKLKYGDIVNVKGSFQKVSFPTNPGQFNYQRYLFLKNITGVFNAKHIEKTAHRFGSPLKRIAIWIRKNIHELNNSTLPPPFNRLYTGLVFGDHGAKLPDEVQENFQKVGLTHLLVVSGSQVSLLSGIILTFIRQFTSKRLLIFSLVTFSNIIFYLLTGGGASIFRAILMNEIALLLLLMNRRNDVKHLIASTALLMLLINPLYLFDLGALLSFLATISLVFGVVPLAQLLPQKWPQKIKEALSMSLSPFIWTTPLLCFSFNSISFVSILSNLIAVQAIELLVVVGFFSSIIGFMVDPISLVLNNFSLLIMLALQKVVGLLVQIPYGNIFIKSPPMTIIVGTYMTMGIIFSALLRKKNRLAKQSFLVYLCIIVLWILPTLLITPNLKVTFIDVGQGDATLIQTPNRQNILIDGGLLSRDFRTGEVRLDVGKRTVMPLLKHYGINKLDLVITTHFDSDHVGGIPTILENFQIGTLMDNGRTEPYFKHYNALREKLKEKYIQAKPGQRFNLGKHTTLDILAPLGIEKETKAKNDQSLVIKLTHGENTFLFTGDLEQHGEARLTAAYQEVLDVDVYKAGHHGSKTSSTLPLLEFVTPKISIISCGRKNKFGHPHQEVLERLYYFSDAVYRTDLGGAIICESDGNEVLCQGYLDTL